MIEVIIWMWLIGALLTAALVQDLLDRGQVRKAGVALDLLVFAWPVMVPIAMLVEVAARVVRRVKR